MENNYTQEQIEVLKRLEPLRKRDEKSYTHDPEGGINCLNCGSHTQRTFVGFQKSDMNSLNRYCRSGMYRTGKVSELFLPAPFTYKDEIHHKKAEKIRYLGEQIAKAVLRDLPTAGLYETAKLDDALESLQKTINLFDEAFMKYEEV